MTFPTICPVCEGEMHASELTCSGCGSSLRGHFESCKYCRLPQPLFDFLDAFLRCRGSIRDLEKEIGMSYPAVKSRIEKLLSALGYGEERAKGRDELRVEILQSVRDGTSSVQEAVEALRRV